MTRVRTLAASALVAAAVGVTGCGGGHATPHPVSGQVTFRGKPLPDAVVTFHPKPGQPPDHPLTATTDADGRFKLSTHAASDGAPAGEYRVTVEFRERRKDGDEVLRNGRNLLPPKYGSPDTSGLTATVRPQDNALGPFALGS